MRAFKTDLKNILRWCGLKFIFDESFIAPIEGKDGFERFQRDNDFFMLFWFKLLQSRTTKQGI